MASSIPSYSNFPKGFPNGVTLRGLPAIPSMPNQVFWVDSNGGSNGNKGTVDRPFATVDYAIGRCAANRGDVIIAKPGHTEALATAGALAIDVAGVSIIGLGQGSLRPTLNLTATASSILVTAANCRLQGFLITGGIDAIVAAIGVQAADFTMDGCETRDVTGETLDWIVTTAAANRFQLLNHRHDGAATAGCLEFLKIVGGDRIVVDGCVIDGNFDVAGINIATTATTDLEVRNCHFRNRVGTQAKDIFVKDTITGSTGLIGPGLYMRLSTNTANVTEAITGATFVVFDDVYVVNLANEKAMLINWTATTDA